HNHASWRSDGFRKIVLNAILWTAHVDVPADGCPSETPSKKAIEENLDGAKKGANKVTAKSIIASMDANKDGKVSKDETSEGLKGFFDQLDRNKDGFLDLKEAQVIADYSNNAQTTKEAEVPRASVQDEAKALRLLVSTLGKVQESGIQASLLEGMLTALTGRRDVNPPRAWTRVAAILAKSSSADVRELTSELSQIFGDEAAVARALATVKDTSAPAGQRRRALHGLLTQKNEQVSGLLESLLDEPALRRDAIRGYAAIENRQAPDILLGRYKKLPVEDRKAVIETLATRKRYGEALLAAITSKQVPRADVPAHVARSLDFLIGDEFVKVFGDVRQLSADRTTLIAKYKKLITEDALDAADPSRGRVVFNKTCASCHVLYDTGGKIGPDLTGSNRANLDYILLNSVDPSYDVPEGYKMVVIQTVDGRVLNGVIAEENAQRVILKTVQQPRVVILKEDIDNRTVSKKSIMPDGQFDQMKPQEVIDLIRYLQTVEQVEVAQ
ncbi:MAG: hypothetical protein VX346_15345, partial [Planctomycetota bacterium]|nr:hypothetical protein [Planctomycetota bacterium]